MQECVRWLYTAVNIVLTEINVHRKVMFLCN